MSIVGSNVWSNVVCKSLLAYEFGYQIPFSVYFQRKQNKILSTFTEAVILIAYFSWFPSLNSS